MKEIKTKKQFIIASIWLILVLLLLKSCLAEFIQPVTEDTYTSETFKNNNYGNVEYMQASYDGVNYEEIIYVQFELDEARDNLISPSYKIIKFDLCFYLSSFSNVNISNFNITLYALDKTFLENSINHNSNYISYWIYNKNITYTLSSAQINNFVCINVENLIINNVDDYFKVVIVTKDNINNYFKIRSKEFGTSQAYLDIEFEKIITPVSIETFEISELSNVVFLFVMIFAYLGVMTLGFMFKNFGFASLGFFLGIIIGFMLSSFSMFLMFVFLLLDIVIYYSFSRTRR